MGVLSSLSIAFRLPSSMAKCQVAQETSGSNYFSASRIHPYHPCVHSKRTSFLSGKFLESPLARRGTEILQVVGKGIQDGCLDRFAISLILYAEKNNQQAQHAQRERKHHGVLEYFVGKMPEIYENAQGPKDQEGAPVKKDRGQHQSQI